MSGQDLWSGLRNVVNVLKLLTLVVGLITLILTADSYYFKGKPFSSILVFQEEAPKEIAFLSFVIIFFILSFIWFFVLTTNKEIPPEKSKIIDITYHGVGGLILAITAGIWFASVANYRSHFESQGIVEAGIHDQYAERIAAGVFGLVNGILYLSVAELLRRQNKEREP